MKPLPGNRADWKFISATACVGALVLLPAILNGIPAGADLTNHLRFALRFYESVHAGDFYPGWLAASNLGYGDPSIRFYPPVLYYLLAAVRFLVGDWYISTLLVFTLLSATAGVGVYLWAKTLFSSKVAFWAGAIYTIAPYHLNQFYQASFLAEYAGSAVLPFVFAFTERVLRAGRMRDLAGLSLSYSLLILTHLPLTVIGSISLFVYALLIIRKPAAKTQFVQLTVAVLLSLLTTAFYWVTVVAELPWIHTEYIEMNVYYDYRRNFLFSPYTLLSTNTWYANMLAVATIGLFLPAVALFWDRRQINKDRRVKALALLLTFTFFMTTDLSRPLWLVIPTLRDIQFPFRWLAIFSLCGSVLVVGSVPYWIDKVRRRFRPRDLLIILAVSLSVIFIVHQIIIDTGYMSRSQLENELQTIPGKVNFKKYLPVWASELGQVRFFPEMVDAGERAVTVTSWEPKRRAFSVAEGKATEARIHTYFYPHWVAETEGLTLPIRPDTDGTLLVTLPANSVSVELHFREPPRTRAAALLSLFGALLIGAIYLFSFTNRALSHKEHH